ncbi:Hypothetical predicted protein, partial [Pelobates cultripes]
RSINFLDVTISITEDGTFHSTLYRKSTATNSLLHWTSHHPRSLKEVIPVGQYLRLRRNCSDIQDFTLKAKQLRQHFKEKGYPNRCLKKAYKRALQTERSDLLCDFSKKITNKDA